MKMTKNETIEVMKLLSVNQHKQSTRRARRRAMQRALNKVYKKQ